MAPEGSALAATSPAISVRGLTVKRGASLVLNGLNLDIPGGCVVGLLGPSGCGKTTLMRAIVGVQKVAAGSVTVLGLPAGSPELRHRVGYVTQSPSVYDDLTVRQNLLYFSRVLRVILDEPTVGLDPVLRVQLWKIFHELADAGTSILVSSHVMDEANRCDRLMLMRAGAVLADDTLDGLLAKTGAADAESAFLALINRHPRHASAEAETGASA